MTLRLSPKQLDIIRFLETSPNVTPEDYAKAHFQSVNTIYVQLGRVKAKDKEARVFRAFLNGTIGRYPWLRTWLKPQPELSPSERATVERGLQNPKEVPVEGRGQARNIKERHRSAKRKYQGYLARKTKSRTTEKRKGKR